MQHLRIITALAAGTAVALTSAPAQARGYEVHNSGACSQRSTWDLKAKSEDGRIEVEFEVDSNRAGQVWSVRLSDNGTRVFTGTRTTQPPSRSFTVRRLIANRSGTDHIRARASRASGESCIGTVRYAR